MFVSLPFEEFLRGVFLYLVSHVPRVWPRARYSLPSRFPARTKNPASSNDISLLAIVSSQRFTTFVIRIDECVTVPCSLISRRAMADDRGSLGPFSFLSRAPRFFEWPSRADQHDAKSSVRAFPHRQTVLHCPRRYVPLPLPSTSTSYFFLLLFALPSFSSTRIIRVVLFGLVREESWRRFLI